MDYSFRHVGTLTASLSSFTVFLLLLATGLLHIPQFLNILLLYCNIHTTELFLLPFLVFAIARL